MILWLASAAIAACPVARTVDELQSALDAVDASWGADPAAFVEAVATSRDILPCVASVVDPQTAAHVHRVEGLDAFLRRDMTAARAAFAAARAADPDWVLPERIAAPGNPLRAEWTALPVVAPNVPLPAPTRGTTRIDGTEGRARAAERPFVAQHLDDTGRSDLAAWVAADAAGPWTAETARAERKSTTPWWIASGASAVAGGALLAAWYDADVRYHEATTVADADAGRVEVNTWAGASTGAGALALGFGIFALVGSF